MPPHIHSARARAHALTERTASATTLGPPVPHDTPGSLSLSAYYMWLRGRLPPTANMYNAINVIISTKYMTMRRLRTRMRTVRYRWRVPGIHPSDRANTRARTLGGARGGIDNRSRPGTRLRHTAGIHTHTLFCAGRSRALHSRGVHHLNAYNDATHTYTYCT